MTNQLTYLKVSNQFLIGAGLLVAAIITLSIPVFSYAADYAYVNQAGEVNMVTASNPNTAIATAPNIDEHSGVLLLDSATDSILDDNVSGT